MGHLTALEVIDRQGLRGVSCGDRLNGRDISLSLDAYLGSRGPCLAVDLALSHELQVARYLGRLQLGHLERGGVFELTRSHCRTPGLTIGTEIDLIGLDHAILRAILTCQIGKRRDLIQS